MASVIIFCLSTHQIIYIFTFLLSGCAILASYSYNEDYVQQEVEVNYAQNNFDLIWNCSWPFLTNLFVQVIAASAYHLYKATNYSISMGKTLTFLVFLQPIVWRLVALPSQYLALVPVFSLVILTLELMAIFVNQLKHILVVFQASYYTSKYMVKNFGLQNFIEAQWKRLHVPDALRMFWLTRILISSIYHVAIKATENDGELTGADVLDVCCQQLVCGCDNIVSLLGMTSVISYLAYHLGLMVAAFIQSENDEDRSMGMMAAILFFILGLQTGLTGLSSKVRLYRLLKNMCLLSTAVLHFTHNMVNPRLMQLSASQQQKHGRPLLLCAMLLLLPAGLLLSLWSQYSVSTWLLAVTAFSLELIIKVIITLLIYMLFLIDASTDTLWEELDDYVYYIQSVGNTIEFLFGIFLFCNGAWIMLFESGGTIRAVMMCIHAYFNIWVQARSGWRAFIQRCTAVQKITSLPEANAQQLANHNDVCAICYQPLLTARITHCQHYFHGVCLRKWLYVRDNCPLCHHSIHPTTSHSANNGYVHMHQD